MKLGIQVAMLLLIAAPASSGFYRTYPDGEGGSVDWDEFRDAFEIPGVGYAACRWEVDNTPPDHEGLAIIDYDGNLTGNLFDGCYAWAYEDGQLVQALFDNEDDRLEVTCYEPDGTLLGTWEYPMPFSGCNWDVLDIALDGGALTLCANHLYYNALAVRISSDHSLGWTRVFPSEIGGYPYVEFRTIGISEDGSLHFGLDESGVYCLDQEGDSLWSWSDPSSTGSIIQIAETDYGCVMACLDCLVAVDQEGEQIWTLESPQEGVCFSGVADAGGGAVVAYSYDYEGGPACLVKLDSSGQEIWSREYPYSGYCTIQRCEDGGYLLSGATGVPVHTAPEDIDPLLIKTDVNGWFGSEGIDPGQGAGNPTIALPSNPVHSMTSVTVAAPAGESIEMELFEMSGRIVTSWSWQSDGDTCIALPNLGPGMYFLVATSGDGRATARFVVVD